MCVCVREGVGVGVWVGRDICMYLCGTGVQTCRAWDCMDVCVYVHGCMGVWVGMWVWLYGVYGCIGV